MIFHTPTVWPFNINHCGCKWLINYASVQYDIMWWLRLHSTQSTLLLSDHSISSTVVLNSYAISCSECVNAVHRHKVLSFLCTFVHSYTTIHNLWVRQHKVTPTVGGLIMFFLNTIVVPSICGNHNFFLSEVEKKLFETANI